MSEQISNPSASVFGKRADAGPRMSFAMLRDGARLRAQARRHGAGVTLVEVLIVVAIIAMVAGGAAVFALPRYRDAQKKSAETWARTIRAAVQNWQSTTNETSCPTVSQLVQEKHLDSGSSTMDPWGQPFQLTCAEDEVFVLSTGPDKKKGTKDDIQVPKAATGAGEAAP